MKLLVAEKPSVATGHYRTMLERCANEKFVQEDGFLRGREYCISWCVGHLVTLAPFDKYKGYDGLWQLENLPLLPDKFKLEAIERTQKQLRVVTGLMQEADVLINGADAGREGNLIFDLVLDYNPTLKKKEVKRLWVNSFVDRDLDAAFEKLESAEERQNLSYAARLRQRADWMVGLNATRAYTLTAGRGKLMSVGRVQTPTLNLVVMRDDEVEGFQELFFYGVNACWKGFAAQWVEAGKLAFHDAPAPSERVINKCRGQEAQIDAIKKSTKRAFPKKPFDLTELQKEANKRYKIKVARVLEVAQSLYEDKFITYPRTDSAYLTEAMKDSAYQLAQKMAGDGERLQMRPLNEKFAFINDKKVTDHFAIIPTDVPPNNLSDESQKIYDLIRDRFVTAWLQPHVWEEHQVQLACQDELFRVKLKRDLHMGYKEIEAQRKQAGESKRPAAGVDDDGGKGGADEVSNTITEPLDWKKGDVAQLGDLEINKKKKSRPKYYTEATLLAAMKTAGKNIEDEELAEAMKERGLGTPATQAGIIETLKRRGFIEESKNKIKSTENGRRLIRLVDDQLKSPEMTGEWEFKLSQIEKGALSPVVFRDEIIDYVRRVFSGLAERFRYDFERERVKPQFACPKCRKAGVEQVLELRNWGYKCEREACGFKMSHTIAEKSLSLDETRELLEQGQLDELEGFRSKRGFLFNAALMMDENFEVVFKFKDARKSVVRPEKCPRCKGELRETDKTVSCGNMRCSFVLWRTVAGLLLPEETVALLLKKKTSALLDGFVSKKGKRFSAKLKLDNNLKVVFEFDDTAPSPDQLSQHCPRCGGPLWQNQHAIYCVDARCQYTLKRRRLQKEIPMEQLLTLLRDGQTDVMEGFVSPKGTPFAARLRLDDNKNAVVDWKLKQNKNLLPE